MTWETAADALEELIEGLRRLVAGGAAAPPPHLPPLDLGAEPDPATRARVEALLAAAGDALAAGDRRLREVGAELDRLPATREAAKGYLAHSGP